MSAHPPIHIPEPERLVPLRYPLTFIFAALSLLGLVVSAIGYFVNPGQFGYSWFLALYFFFSIALGSFFWVTLHYACDSNWTVLARRTWENILFLFPLLFVLFLPLFLPGVREVLWEWMSPHANHHELAKRAGYLNLSFFVIRYLIYFLYFWLAGLFYYRHSVRQDTDGSPVHSRRMHDHSYFALVVFGTLETFLGIDWLMGLDWRWSSSLFGVYTFSISAQASMAAGIVLIAILRSAGFLRAMNAEHFYLMGKLLFGFTIFWAYIAFGQYLLIWYANIPEESIFYNNHNRGHWYLLSYFIVIGKFAFPTFYLLAQDTKKSLKALTFIAAWLLFMHGIELYWFVAPFANHGMFPSWQDFVAFITITSILGFAFIHVAARSSLFPTRDPRLVDCLTIKN